MPLSPFLIARTSAAIIKNHGDTWNEKFTGWLFAYVNELGKQHRPRSFDKEEQEIQDVSSTAEPVGAIDACQSRHHCQALRVPHPRLSVRSTPVAVSRILCYHV